MNKTRKIGASILGLIFLSNLTVPIYATGRADTKTEITYTELNFNTEDKLVAPFTAGKLSSISCADTSFIIENSGESVRLLLFTLDVL